MFARYRGGCRRHGYPKTSMLNLIPLQTASRSPGMGLLVMAIAISCAACGHSPEMLAAFRTEQQAKEHRPTDTVIWVDPPRRHLFPQGARVIR